MGGVATLTADGGTTDGEVVEKKVASPARLHIAGDATCGTPLRG